MEANLILVHGLFARDKAIAPDNTARARAIAEHGKSLGVGNYEWVSGRNKRLANYFLRRARGTAPAVDAVEIIELNEAKVRVSLTDDSARSQWQQILSCEAYGLDRARSFILMGAAQQQVEGPAKGQRLLWFGRGLAELTETEFIEHYTGHHGPLVASYAKLQGLRRYAQVASEQNALCDSLRKLGLGQALAPPVFGELFMSIPPIGLSSLRMRRIASKEIEADEKRHIDFSRSMLLLA